MAETSELKLLDDIQLKDELAGVVKKIDLAGAVIDVGADREALLHISQLQPGRVNNVRDVLTEGQQVTVWVHSLDRKKGRLDVTMIKPPAVSWKELKSGSVHKGTVVRIEKFGVFVDIGAERPGLVHISELSNDYVQKAEDVVKKGDEVEVKVIGLNRRKSQIDLSMKALGTSAVEEHVEEETPQLTAMAAALQKAMAVGKEDAQPTRPTRSDSGKQRSQQDDILRRTLEQHSPQS